MDDEIYIVCLCAQRNAGNNNNNNNNNNNKTEFVNLKLLLFKMWNT